MKRLLFAPAFEGFTDSPDYNESLISSAKTVAELRDLLNQMPYFKKSDTPSDINWLAFPLTSRDYILAVYAIDDVSGIIYRCYLGVQPISNRTGSAETDALAFAPEHKIRENLYSRWSFPLMRWAVTNITPQYSDVHLSDSDVAEIFHDNKQRYINSGRLDSISDADIQRDFESLKNDVLPYYSSALSATSTANDTVLTDRDAYDYMRQVGGEITYKGTTGLPLFVKDSDGRLRVLTNDGVNGVAFVQFPKDARSRNALYIIPSKFVKWTDRGFYRLDGVKDVSIYRVS